MAQSGKQDHISVFQKMINSPIIMIISLALMKTQNHNLFLTLFWLSRNKNEEIAETFLAQIHRKVL